MLRDEINSDSSRHEISRAARVRMLRTSEPMDTRHQRVSVLLQMSGVYIALQRFVKRIGQSHVPPQPGLRGLVGKRKMQPEEFIRRA